MQCIEGPWELVAADYDGIKVGTAKTTIATI